MDSQFHPQGQSCMRAPLATTMGALYLGHPPLMPGSNASKHSRCNGWWSHAISSKVFQLVWRKTFQIERLHIKAQHLKVLCSAECPLVLERKQLAGPGHCGEFGNSPRTSFDVLTDIKNNIRAIQGHMAFLAHILPTQVYAITQPVCLSRTGRGPHL